MLKTALIAAIVIVAGATGASAQYYGGYGSRGYGQSQSEAFAREAARDGRISKDEHRIIQQLRAREAYGHRSREHYREPPRRHYRPYGYDRY